MALRAAPLWVLRPTWPTGLLQPSLFFFKKFFGHQKFKFQRSLSTVLSPTPAALSSSPQLQHSHSLNPFYPFSIFSCFFKTLTQLKHFPPTNSNPSNLQNSLHLILNFSHSLRPLFKFSILIH